MTRRRVTVGASPSRTTSAARPAPVQHRNRAEVAERMLESAQGREHLAGKLIADLIAAQAAVQHLLHALAGVRALREIDAVFMELHEGLLRSRHRSSFLGVEDAVTGGRRFIADVLRQPNAGAFTDRVADRISQHYLDRALVAARAVLDESRAEQLAAADAILRIDRFADARAGVIRDSGGIIVDRREFSGVDEWYEAQVAAEPGLEPYLARLFDRQ